MRRFVFTSNGFKGSVESMYDSNGRLIIIDFSKATLSETAISFFKKQIPVIVDNIQPAFEGVNCTVKEEDIEVSFEDFWRSYPYKRNRHLAEAYWPKLTANQQYRAFISAIEYRQYLERNKWLSPKIADTWLKQKEYMNDFKTL